MRKRILIIPAFLCLLLSSACSGECVRCQKQGETTLNYCETDFPDKNAYNEQVAALKALGYTCGQK
ncbi:MAG: hypothetical protein IBJ09_05760 [Bacteroidia bacterium]|nr:hypothetical protein [Bacteroidia bacterium]